MTASIDWNALHQAALQAQASAYAPYSKFAVGAALLGDDGVIYRGANIENASYGLCLCAERCAVANAVTAGARAFAALAIVSPANPPATPCGMCRQVLAEFSPNLPVYCYAPDGTVVRTDIAELLPLAFTPGQLSAR